MMSASITVFVVSVVAILYVIGGYPLLLAWLASRNSRPVLKDSVIRDISIVIAAHNGEQFVEAKLQSVLALNYPRGHMQIIFVSDGSTDRTDEIAQSFRGQGVEFYRIEKSGKAGAVNCGISHATGEILVLNDVRQTVDPESVRNVVACFADPRVGAVSGKLHIRTGQISEEADTGLYWKYEVFIRKQMSRIDSTFGTSGHFYALRRTLAVPIPPDTLLDDVYLPLSAFFRGYRLVLEESAKTFDYPTNLNSEFKRKVRTQAGLYQILREYPQLLSSSNRMRIHFLSAKFARLLLPFLLILILFSSFGLPEPFAEIAIAAQVIFYGIAFFDRWIPEDRLIKSVSSPIRTFVVLMAASLMACKIFFIPAKDLWKETKVRVG
jgi:biofilm PGA synthesis N-glycosyltransferase PgaC